MQLSLGKLRQNKRNKTKLWGGFYGWIISSKMKITQSKKQLTFWRTLLIFGLVVCGPSSVKKMCLLILQAAFFLSTGGFLFSSLLLPAYGAWPCFSFTTLSNLPRQKNIGVLMGGPDCFQHTKGLSSLCLRSYLSCEPRLRPRASHASSTGTSASSSTSSSWLWRDQPFKQHCIT